MAKLIAKNALSLKYTLRSVRQMIKGLIKALRLGRYWLVSWRIQSKWRKLESEDRFMLVVVFERSGAGPVEVSIFRGGEHDVLEAVVTVVAQPEVVPDFVGQDVAGP